MAEKGERGTQRPFNYLENNEDFVPINYIDGTNL